MNLFKPFAFLTACAALAGPLAAQDRWDKDCPVSRNACMQKTKSLFAFMGSNGCLLSAGNTEQAVNERGSIQGSLMCEAHDFSKLTFADIWIADYQDGASTPATLRPLFPKIERPTVESPAVHIDSHKYAYDSAGTNGELALAWSFTNARLLNKSPFFSYASAIGGYINGDPYKVNMLFNKHSGQDEVVFAVAESDDLKHLEQNLVQPIPVQNTIAPVSLGALIKNGAALNVTPYDAMRRTIFLTPEEKSNLGKTTTSWTMLNPALYKQAVFNRFMGRKGEKPRYLHAEWGASEFGVEMGAPSDLKFHEKQGLFQPILLSARHPDIPKSLFGVDRFMYGEIGLTTKDPEQFVVLEFALEGGIWMHSLRKGVDPKVAPVTEGQKKANASGYTLSPLCETSLNAKSFKTCGAGETKALFYMNYITRPDRG